MNTWTGTSKASDFLVTIEKHTEDDMSCVLRIRSKTHLETSYPGHSANLFDSYREAVVFFVKSLKNNWSGMFDRNYSSLSEFIFGGWEVPFSEDDQAEILLLIGEAG